MNRSSRTVIRATAAFLFALTGVAGATRAQVPATSLQFSLPAGKVLRYELQSEEKTIQGSISVVSNVSAQVEVAATGKTAAGDTKLDVRFVHYQRTSQAGTLPARQDPPVENQSLHLQVSPRGKVTGVQADSSSAANQSRLEDLAKALFINLPAQPVHPGDKWTEPVEVGKGEVKGTTEYTLVKVESKPRALARLTAQTHFTTSSPALQGSGEMRAAIAIDGGYPIEAKAALNMKGRGVSGTQSFECKLQ